MKGIARITGFLIVAALSFYGCQKKTEESAESPPVEMAESLPAEMTESPPVEMVAPAAFEGIVMSTVNGAGFTYVELEQGGKKVWIVGPQADVKAGDTVSAPGEGMPMYNFESKSLSRTFEIIYFVDTITVGGGGAPAAVGTEVPDKPDAPSPGSVTKAEAGYTLEELIVRKESLAGTKVAVRGRVIKINRNIMDRNWIHIQDGTGGETPYDIIVTTGQDASIGDTILVNATLSLDRDFGAGYLYDVILEDAQIKVE